MGAAQSGGPRYSEATLAAFAGEWALVAPRVKALRVPGPGGFGVDEHDLVRLVTAAALACDALYRHGSGADAVRRQLAEGKARLFPAFDPSCVQEAVGSEGQRLMLLELRHAILVVCLGSTARQDWYHSLTVHATVTASGSRSCPLIGSGVEDHVHGGYLSGARSINTAGLLRYASGKKKPLVFTGHSRGGAMAELCARECGSMGKYAVLCITFAAPQVLLRAGTPFPAAADRCVVLRYTVEGDLLSDDEGLSGLHFRLREPRLPKGEGARLVDRTLEDNDEDVAVSESLSMAKFLRALYRPGAADVVMPEAGVTGDKPPEPVATPVTAERMIDVAWPKEERWWSAAATVQGGGVEIDVCFRTIRPNIDCTEADIDALFLLPGDTPEPKLEQYFRTCKPWVSETVQSEEDELYETHVVCRTPLAASGFPIRGAFDVSLRHCFVDGTLDLTVPLTIDASDGTFTDMWQHAQEDHEHSKAIFGDDFEAIGAAVPTPGVGDGDSTVILGLVAVCALTLYGLPVWLGLALDIAKEPAVAWRELQERFRRQAGEAVFGFLRNHGAELDECREEWLATTPEERGVADLVGQVIRLVYVDGEEEAREAIAALRAMPLPSDARVYNRLLARLPARAAESADCPGLEERCRGVASANALLMDSELPSNASLAAFAALLVLGTVGAVFAQPALLALARHFGKAGTGTAISKLSGSAASKASLAFLGGGPVSKGGMGMAGGRKLIGGVEEMFSSGAIEGGRLFTAALIAKIRRAKDLSRALARLGIRLT